jgi:hypothetical protein
MIVGERKVRLFRLAVDSEQPVNVAWWHKDWQSAMHHSVFVESHPIDLVVVDIDLDSD